MTTPTNSRRSEEAQRGRPHRLLRRPQRAVGIFTDPRHVILYTSNGEVRQEFSVVFTARPIGGEPTPSDESREVHWVDPDALDSLRMDRSMRMRIERYLTGDGAPHLG